MTEYIPVFQNIPISSIRKSQFLYIDDKEILSQPEFEEFLEFLEEAPDVDIYLFSRRDRGMNTFVLGALQAGIIRAGPSEMNWYPHPKFQNDYVQIGFDPYWDWEREVKETAPAYVRTQVSLSDQERRRRELLEAAEIQQSYLIFLRYLHELSTRNPEKNLNVDEASKELGWDDVASRRIILYLERSSFIKIADNNTVTLTRAGSYQITQASRPAELFAAKPGPYGFNVDLKVLWRKFRNGGIKAFWRLRR